MARKRLPAATSFKQQRLRACSPILTPIPVISTFALIGVIFIPIGVVLLLESQDITEIEIRYDKICRGLDTCSVNITVGKRMEGPVYFYYGLKNYNQNHRRYVKSRDDGQLAGDSTSASDAEEFCDPFTTLNDSGNNDDLFLPCGLIARSYFNDTFELLSEGGGARVPAPVPWTNDGVAWESDLDQLYDNPKNGTPGICIIPTVGEYCNGSVSGRADDGICSGQVPDEVCYYENPDFVVWMRVAALPSFRKFHRIIPGGLNPGSYTVEIDNNYDVSEFDGEKLIIFSTSSWIGGKNEFLGIAYLVVGSFTLVLALIFLIKHKLSPRKFGDLSLLAHVDATFEQ
mmetsp:Transcript_22924/g.64414  ORF Transcript_22924/g.64414 Transcript_22924/m.64414 type:complete len:343 (+) Transcript_22924:142-1170(+)|eukprot:CAMPEP_0119120424 /NCGR_PEP_ID=MMETSP1310-20130426/1465_1 /TAXON_ID=464262 /ORGANISM="Genus nov. species nov., Strain RCC2339" /LENGTH=342 /DNA_ID=CAMNT_0007109901 /DNA_START=152 /DNA_END=1180 /DNA_ORIENTATION=+